MDTVRDVKAAWKFLELLDEFDAQATFFITTGLDDSGRGLFRAFRRSLRGSYRARYGLNGFGSLFRPYRSVEAHLKDMCGKLNGRHEVALHGYMHRRWVRGATKWPVSQATAHVVEGVRRFEEAFGFKPLGFAAPGFVVTDSILSALDGLGFLYASNFRQEVGMPFKLRGFNLVELPVTGYNIEELLYQGLSRETVSRTIVDKISVALDAGRYFCYYTHPSYDVYVDPDGIRHVLSFVKNRTDVWMPTMMRVAEWMKSADM